jgi:uncharacterized protein (TIGR02246 family)
MNRLQTPREASMRTRHTLFCLLLAAGACTTDNAARTDTAAATTAGDDAAATSAIGTVRSSWKEAADRKDSTAIAAFYEDDAILASSGGPVSNGRAAIEQAVGRLVNSVRVMGIDSKDLTLLGDDAFDYGTYTQEVTGADGKVNTLTGYYIVHLHRQSDGSWKIRRHLDVIPPNPPGAP